MGMQAFDTRTLSWVKDEVQAVLEPVERALQSLEQDQQGIEVLQGAAEAADRIRGAMEIIGIQGATMLAKELEVCLRGMAAGSISTTDDHLEVVLRAMLQLPAYLDQLYHGHRDIPLVLLPLLNDLRAVQDAELLTEAAFFSPDLSVTTPPGYQPGPATFDVQTTAKKLRAGYLAALLALIRGQDAVAQLRLLGSIITNFQHASRRDRVIQLWWVASGLITSLYDGGLETSVAVKILLGRLDRQTRRLIDYGEADLQANPPRELLKNMLYYIGQSRSSAARVRELKGSFHLEGSMPDASEVKRAREDLYGYNANLIANISEQIREEMSAIKDMLDIAVHSRGGSTEGMEPILGHMHTVADALGMMGLARFARAIHEFEAVLKPRIEAGAVLDEDNVMRMASTIMYIESSLCDLDAAGNDADSLEMSMSRAEFSELRKTVAAEVIKDMKSIRGHIESWLQDFNPAHIGSVIGLLRMLEGAATLLQCNDQASVLDGLARYFRERWGDLNSAPPMAELDRVANVIVGVEHYFETILEQAVAPELAMSLAAHSLRELGYECSIADELPGLSAPVPAPAPERGAAAAAAKAGEEKRVLRVIDGPTGEETLHAFRDADQDIAALIGEFAAAEEVDPELVQVFLAEAEEVLNKVESDLHAWQREVGNQTLLYRLIRSFHTLKGAGRIIGATNIGVLSWAIEELLRRVAEGPLNVSEGMFTLLERTLTALRDLTAELQGGVGPSEKVEELINAARELRTS